MNIIFGKFTILLWVIFGFLGTTYGLPNQDSIDGADISPYVWNQLQSVNDETDLLEIAIVVSKEKYNELKKQGEDWLDKVPFNPEPDPTTFISGDVSETASLRPNPTSAPGRDLEEFEEVYVKMVGSVLGGGGQFGVGQQKGSPGQISSPLGSRKGGARNGGSQGKVLSTSSGGTASFEVRKPDVIESVCAAKEDCQLRPECLTPTGIKFTHNNFYIPFCIRVMKCGGPCCTRNNSRGCLARKRKTKKYLVKEYQHAGLNNKGIPVFVFIQQIVTELQEDEVCSCVERQRSEIQRNQRGNC